MKRKEDWKWRDMVNYDKMQSHHPIMDCLSNCCGASSNSDMMICSECREHCDIYYEDDDE